VGELLAVILSFDQIVNYTCFQFVIAKLRETKRAEPSDSTFTLLIALSAPQLPNTQVPGQRTVTHIRPPHEKHRVGLTQG